MFLLQNIIATDLLLSRPIAREISENPAARSAFAIQKLQRRHEIRQFLILAFIVAHATHTLRIIYIALLHNYPFPN